MRLLLKLFLPVLGGSYSKQKTNNKEKQVYFFRHHHAQQDYGGAPYNRSFKYSRTYHKTNRYKRQQTTSSLFLKKIICL